MDSKVFQYIKNESKNHQNKQVSKNISNLQKNWVLIFFIIIELLIIIFYGVGVEYNITAKRPEENGVGNMIVANEITKLLYPSFQDVQVMVFVGFGFLMAYLKYHAWSSISFNMIIAALCIQFSIICMHFWESIFKSEWHKLQLDLSHLIRGDFAAATVLISYGAVIGKFNLSQYLMMGFLEVIFSTLNQVICEYELRAIDMGGSMYIHAFGAYFGLAVVMAYKFKKAQNNERNTSGYYSNTFALIGTIFLFMYWPSFNSALANGTGRQRIIINTFFSIVGSVVGVFIVSPLWSNGKLNIENVLNSTVAGGVAAGANADLVQNVSISILTGFLAGILCSLGFSFLSKFLNKKIGLQDTAGVHNLHGMPGVFSALIAVFAVLALSKEEFQLSVGDYFDVKTDRSNQKQAGFQFAALIVTLVLSLTSGFIVGKILSLKCFNQSQYLFSDANYWLYEEDEEVNFEMPKEQLEFSNNANVEQIALQNKASNNYYETEDNKNKDVSN